MINVLFIWLIDLYEDLFVQLLIRGLDHENDWLLGIWMVGQIGSEQKKENL